MIISNAIRFSTNDVADYSWSRLSQFHNVGYTAQIISALHQLGKEQEKNARSQAEQIKYCLVQAKEYFRAASHVTLATRPVLLYYGVMSLALAEILLKQDANSRLQKLRAENPCHGLTLAVSEIPKIDEMYAISASRLLAKVQLDSTSSPRGTFEVWRRSAREFPIGAEIKQALQTGGEMTGWRMILTPTEDPPPPLKKAIDLGVCIANLPYMTDILQRWGSRIEMVRGRISGSIAVNNLGVSMQIIIQPAPLDLIEKFGAKVIASPAMVNHVDIHEFPSGYQLTIPAGNSERFSLPHATCIDSVDTYFNCCDENLGEFGYLYVALHILGNFARYYPDIWMRHIEHYSPLANVVDELCKHSMERLPLLSLSEMTRTYHVMYR